MARRSNHGRPPGPSIGRPQSPTRVALAVTDDDTTETVARQLADLGCLNPSERARDLLAKRICRFYRPTDDSIVTVTLKENP